MKVRIIISVVAVIIIGTATCLFLRWANSPSRQEVGVAQVTQIVPAQTQDVETAFFRTKLPTSFHVQQTSKANVATSLQLSASESGGERNQVGITTALIPSDGLSGIPDYLLRVRKTDIYVSVPTTDFPADSKTFKKVDGGEITTFIIHNNRYASVAVSSSVASESDLLALRKQIANAWQWL